MRNRLAYHKLIVPISWLVLSLLVAFLLAKYIIPEENIEKKWFGLRTIHHYSFNYRLFFLTLTLSISALALYMVLRTFKGFRNFIDNTAIEIGQSPWFILGLTLSSACFFVLGISKPLFLSEQFFILEKEITLLNSIRMLFQSDETFLGVIILIFTLVFPIFKYLLLFFSMILNDREKLYRFNAFISVVSKWSMLDVYIVALLLLNMKFESRIVNMELKSGVVWFSLSIILIMLAMFLQGKRIRRD
jgi:paraquat-inducible protein A